MSDERHEFILRLLDERDKPQAENKQLKEEIQLWSKAYKRAYEELEGRRKEANRLAESAGFMESGS